MSDINAKNINISVDIQEEKNIAKDKMNHIPNWIESILVMPKNPAKVTELINQYRKMQAANDDDYSQSLHEYYSNKAW